MRNIVCSMVSVVSSSSYTQYGILPRQSGMEATGREPGPAHITNIQISCSRLTAHDRIWVKANSSNSNQLTILEIPSRTCLESLPPTEQAMGSPYF